MGLLSGFRLWSRFLQISPIYKGNLAGRASSPEHFLEPPLPAPPGLISHSKHSFSGTKGFPHQSQLPPRLTAPLGIGEHPIFLFIFFTPGFEVSRAPPLLGWMHRWGPEPGQFGRTGLPVEVASLSLYYFLLQAETLA